MAENEPKPADVDALAAMASGADLNEPDPYKEQLAELSGRLAFRQRPPI